MIEQKIMLVNLLLTENKTYKIRYIAILDFRYNTKCYATYHVNIKTDVRQVIGTDTLCYDHKTNDPGNRLWWYTTHVIFLLTLNCLALTI